VRGETGASWPEIIADGLSGPSGDPRLARRRRLGFLVGVGLAAVAGGLIGASLLGGDDDANAPAASKGRVRFVTAAAYDPPPGDGEEHDEEVGNAIDGMGSTAWSTEHYRSFDKGGVGLVVGASRPVSPRTLVVTSDTPGFKAQIKAGASNTGPFRPVSSAQTADFTTRFALRGSGRYFLIWITDLGGNDQVRIVEVRAR